MAQPPIKKRKGDVLGGLVASVQETAREVGGLHARDAAKGAASLVAKEQSLKGANVEASLANALNALRTAAQGIGGAIEVECRVGVACEKGAGLGSATAAAKRFVAGRRGCGAVAIGGSSDFCPGVSEVAFREAQENVERCQTVAWTESVESTFGAETGPRLVVSSDGRQRLEQKSKLDTHDFALPSAAYDVRLQVASEANLPLSQLPEPTKKHWTFRRIKKRRSCAPASFRGWRVDLTEVTRHDYTVDKLTTTTALEVAKGKGPAPASSSTVYEVEVELDSAATARWLALPMGVSQEEKMIADVLSAVLRVLNPVEATDTRGNPAVPAPKMLQNIAKSVLRGIQAGQSRAFPGAMPVGLARRNMKDVRTNYFVAEKSDGERRLLVAVHDKAAGRVRCCLVDRKGTVEVARVTGGKPLKPGTVLDGEIVRNLAHQAPVFLIFDVLHNGQEDVSQATFSQRYFGGLSSKTLKDCLSTKCPPPTATKEDGMHDDGSFQVAVHQPSDPNDALLKDAPALPLVPKRFVSSRRCGEILAKITQDNDEEGSVPFGCRVSRDGAFRTHRSDGLVFVPDTPYIAGTDHSLLKWKARDQLTVDLTVRGAGKGEGLGFFAVDDDGGDVDCSKHVHLSEQDAARLRADVADRPSRVTVAELGLDSSSGLWVYHAVRPDKDGGNHFDTFLSTLLLHAESPSEPELRYRLSSPTDDWAKREDGALLAAASPWREQFSKSQNRPFWWNSVTDEKSWARPAPFLSL
jgi:hypothetical protein